MENTQKITITPLTDYLICHYGGQTDIQDTYVCLDCANATLSADYNPEIGDAVPMSVYNHHTLRFPVSPYLNPDSYNDLLNEIRPLAEKIVDGYESHWDGNNHVGKYTPDTYDAIAEMQGIIWDAENDFETYETEDFLSLVTSHKPGRTVIDCDPDLIIITPETPDEVLDRWAETLDNDALSDGVYLMDCKEHLYGLRDAITEA